MKHSEDQPHGQEKKREVHEVVQICNVMMVEILKFYNHHVHHYFNNFYKFSVEHQQYRAGAPYDLKPWLQNLRTFCMSKYDQFCIYCSIPTKSQQSPPLLDTIKEENKKGEHSCCTSWINCRWRSHIEFWLFQFLQSSTASSSYVREQEVLRNLDHVWTMNEAYRGYRILNKVLAWFFVNTLNRGTFLEWWIDIEQLQRVLFESWTQEIERTTSQNHFDIDHLLQIRWTWFACQCIGGFYCKHPCCPTVTSSTTTSPTTIFTSTITTTATTITTMTPSTSIMHFSQDSKDQDQHLVLWFYGILKEYQSRQEYQTRQEYLTMRYQGSMMRRLKAQLEKILFKMSMLPQPTTLINYFFNRYHHSQKDAFQRS